MISAESIYELRTEVMAINETFCDILIQKEDELSDEAMRTFLNIVGWSNTSLTFLSIAYTTKRIEGTRAGKIIMQNAEFAKQVTPENIQQIFDEIKERVESIKESLDEE